MNNEQLSGIIDRFIFHNDETGFSVMVVSDKKNNPTTVTGTFANIQAGQEIHLEGTWSYHAKFGKQFIASTYTTTLPNNIMGIKKYLGSGFIKGIGKVYADKIVSHFKEKTLEIIDHSPDRLREVEGIGKKRIEQIKHSWIDQKFVAKIMVFLQEKGITPTYATKIYKKYGHDAIPLLTQNPYRLTDDIWGIGFKIADQIAQNMGFATGSTQRMQAGLLFTLHTASTNGHIYQEVTQLKNSSYQLLELDPEMNANTMKQSLHELYNADKIKLITHQEKHYVGLSSLYGSEKGIARKIETLQSHTSRINVDQKELYDWLQKNMKLALHEQQQKGILSCFEHKVSIITGGPGTGKTTLISTLLDLLDHHQMKYKLAAPTGRAAKRMMEGTRRHATTIHRLLEIDPASFTFQRNEENALDLDFLIIDESSMIDVFLAHSIFKAIPLNAHLILIGDVDQLPSVGPGSILQDLIQSDKVGCTKLSQIFRQSNNSMIISNAHKVNNGEFPSNQIENCKKDFYFIKEDEPENVFPLIKKILSTTLKNHNIKLDETIILTPMNRGAVGTQKLNYDLQQLLNPHLTKEQYTFAGTTFKKGDRVMQIRNNYDKKVFNGDIGIIEHVDTEEKEMSINFEGTSVPYDFDELSELVLSYAITIHKSQGSEYDAVIIPVFMQHFMLLQKNLIYTAITRAKKLCIFIGQTRAIAMAIKNSKSEERITFLDAFLTENLSCR